MSSREDESTKRIVEYVRQEHARWLNLIGSDDPYVGQTTIGIREVLMAHFLLAEFFAEVGEGLGGIGPKDLNLLHSALSRQFVQFAGTPKWTDRVDVCASLMFGLIKNIPSTTRISVPHFLRQFCISRKLEELLHCPSAHTKTLRSRSRQHMSSLFHSLRKCFLGPR